LEWKSFFNNYVKRVGLNNRLNVELENVCLTNNKIVTKMKLSDFHMAATGFVHGGSIATVADTAIGFGCLVHAPETATGFAVTNTSINYLHSATPGDTLFSEAQLIHKGVSTQLWNASITSSEGSTRKLALIVSSALNLYQNPLSTSKEPSPEKTESKKN